MKEENNLIRSLGLLDATMFVTGSMIGSGIFIVSADMARTVGSSGWLIALWVLTGFLTLLAALSYGELAGMMPKAGGQFVYIEKAYGKFTAFLYGWSVFTVIQSGVIAAVAVAFAKFTSIFIPFLSPENVLFTFLSIKINAAQVFAILSIIYLTWINSNGIKNGKWIQRIFTITKLVALFALIIIGLIVGLKTDVFSNNMTHLWDAKKAIIDGDSFHFENLSGFALTLALGTAIIGSLFSSDAWNNVTFIAGEIKDPKKNIPLSLMLGTLTVTVIYISANFAYLALLPLKGSPYATDIMGQGIMFAGGGTDRVGTAAASMIFGNTASYIMAALIMISTFGCNSGIILSGSRVYYAMAKDGLFFKQAQKLNKHNVPALAMWLQCIWACLLCLSGSYGELLDYTTFISLLFYVITIGGIFILRVKNPEMERPYKVFAYPLLPALYIFFALSICAILLYTKPNFTINGLIIVAIGIPFYYLNKRNQKA